MRRNEVKMVPKLSEMKSNAQIIHEFESFLRAKSFDTSTNNSSSLSTVRKMLGHLFHYDDSLLNFLSKKIENYDLGRHFSQMSDDFLEVRDPSSVGDWIHSIAGPSGKQEPGRRKEMLKSHARWRDYVYEKLENLSFGSSAEAFHKKDIILRNLKNITEKIASKKIFHQLTKLENQNRTLKQKARQLLFPSQNFQEQQAVKVWFQSNEAKAEEESCMKIYLKSMSGSKMSFKDFTRFANLARFTLALEDRNRRSAYNFTNDDFSTRIPKWIPVQESQDVSGSELDRFEMIPEGFNADVPPQAGVKPTCWVLEVCGDTKGLKGGRPANIILTNRSLELCLKFKDLKNEVLEETRGEDFFFVNSKGKCLAPLQRTPGSLLEKLGGVCDLNNPTINTFRRAAEVSVQASPAMKNSVENLQSHSKGVGLTHYDRSSQNTRANFISQLSAIESPKEVESIPKNIRKKREADEKLEREKVIEKAKLTLAHDKMNKKQRLGKTCKVQPRDREFLQEIFSGDKVEEITRSRVSFPGIFLMLYSVISLKTFV